MLDGFARHGLFDLNVKVRGDLEVDSHHTIEDTGIVLGQAIAQALGDKAGIKRYGYFVLPMDEVLALGAVDLFRQTVSELPGRFYSTGKSLEQWIQRWCVNFSMQFPIVLQ